MKTLKNDYIDARNNATKITNIDPKLAHRWILHIDGVNIESHLFQEVTLPTIKKTKQRWGSTKTEVSPIRFSIIETVNSNHYGTFVHKLKNDDQFNITIQTLSPVGEELTKFILEKCRVIEISQSEFNYEKDGLIKTYVHVKPVGVKFSL